MDKSFHTIILVPHARARLRKWRVSNRQIVFLGTLLVVVTLAAAFFTWGYFTRTVDSAEIERLHGENEELRQVNLSFEQNVLQLQQKLADYEDRTMELAIVAGLDPTANGDTGTAAEAGIGGGDLTAVGDLGDLEMRTSRLDGVLDQVATRLQEQLRWISSTPAITPAPGILTSGFGMRKDPITRSRTFHAGLDIAASPGAPVRATADGVVTRAGRNGGLGKAVFVSHGFGISTRYGHLSKLSVEPGTRVARGDVVGYVGSTGRSTGYHLHYEVHVDGKPVNPMGYLLDRPVGR